MKTPRKYQKEVISKFVKHFEGNDRGNLIMACGLGKTLTSLWLAERMKVESLLVAIPTLQLQAQSLRSWMKEIGDFDYAVLAIGSDKTIEKTLGVQVTTDVEVIANFLKKKGKKVVFSTYKSVEALSEATKKMNFQFELAIMDEAHKTSGRKGKESAALISDENVAIKKRLFMTATPVFYEGDKGYSMDDEAVYGKTVFRYSTEQGIKDGFLCDYKVLVLYCKDPKAAKELNKKDAVQYKKVIAEQREWAVATALSKAIKKYDLKKVISFHASIKRAKNFMAAFMAAFNQVDSQMDLYHINYKHSGKDRMEIIDQMKSSGKAIVTNSRTLGTGFDMPEIDTCNFGDMVKSTVEIQQNVGRAIRLSEEKEMAYIVVPLFVTDDKILNEKEYIAVSNALSAMAIEDNRILSEIRGDKKRQNKNNKVVFENLLNLPQIEMDKVREAVQLRSWGRLKLYDYTPFEELKQWFQDNLVPYGITSYRGFCAFKRGELDIPVEYPKNAKHPTRYEEYKSWLDFVGSVDYMPFEELKQWFQDNLVPYGITSYRGFCAFKRGELDIPVEYPKNAKHPMRYEEYKGWVDFVGPVDYMPFEELKQWFQDNIVPYGVTSYHVFFDFKRGELDIPVEYPKNAKTPMRYEEYKGWADFVGKRTISKATKKVA